MARDYFLYHLNDTEFEDLVAIICQQWLGNGITPFAKGKDGGRDAKFKGKAQNYPAHTEPWAGNIVVQAKHTAKPDASCSENSFKKYFQKNKTDSELPKIERLINDGLLDFYLVFTNRKLTGGTDEKILKEVLSLGAQDAQVIGLERIQLFLKQNPEVAKKLPIADFHRPFDFVPDDMVEVISGVYEVIKIETSSFSSAKDFEYLKKKQKKNKINKMSENYYKEVIVNQYMPLFSRLKDFLQNSRNEKYRSIYHDIADELRQKIIQFRDNFDGFEEVIIYLFDLIKELRPDLQGKRRYVTFLLCYMYFDCDIGERES